jgi:hypothetical protein
MVAIVIAFAIASLALGADDEPDGGGSECIDCTVEITRDTAVDTRTARRILAVSLSPVCGISYAMSTVRYDDGLILRVPCIAALRARGLSFDVGDWHGIEGLPSRVTAISVGGSRFALDAFEVIVPSRYEGLPPTPYVARWAFAAP